MSDTPPAEAESGSDPVSDQAAQSSILSESHPTTSDDNAAAERLAEGNDGPPPAPDTVNGTLLWPNNGSSSYMPESRASDVEATTFPPTGHLEATSAPELAPPDEQSMEHAPWLPTGEADGIQEGAEGAPPRRSAWAVLWPWGVHGVIETVEVLALALLMFLLVRSVAQNFVVEGGSMEPTFHDGEMLIVNKLAYRTFDVSWLPFTDKDNWRPFGAPQPGDVVVFKFPQDQNRDFIKRIVAVPGQTVEVRGGKVFIDGVERREPYLDQAPTYDYGPTAVPEGQIFVLGDNRNNSYDSHSWGLLDQSLLIGRAEFRYWPFDRIGRIDHGGLSVGTAVTVNPEASSSPTAR